MRSPLKIHPAFSCIGPAVNCIIPVFTGKRWYPVFLRQAYTRSGACRKTPSKMNTYRFTCVTSTMLTGSIPSHRLLSSSNTAIYFEDRRHSAMLSGESHGAKEMNSFPRSWSRTMYIHRIPLKWLSVHCAKFCHFSKNKSSRPGFTVQYPKSNTTPSWIIDITQSKRDDPGIKHLPGHRKITVPFQPNNHEIWEFCVKEWLPGDPPGKTTPGKLVLCSG